MIYSPLVLRFMFMVMVYGYWEDNGWDMDWNWACEISRDEMINASLKNVNYLVIIPWLGFIYRLECYGLLLSPDRLHYPSSPKPHYHPQPTYINNLNATNAPHPNNRRRPNRPKNLPLPLPPIHPHPASPPRKTTSPPPSSPKKSA